MPTSPNSFSMTAIFLPWFPVRMWLTRVVLPAPRNPVMMETGILGFCGGGIRNGWGVSLWRERNGRVQAVVERSTEQWHMCKGANAMH